MRGAPKLWVTASTDADERVDGDEPVDSDELVDSDVPAAVVCARCGDADCTGCLHEQTMSGVVAVVPWERPGGATLSRLWATARASAFESEAFFASMPDGPIGPALSFAAISELLAATAMGLVALVPVSLFAPGWMRHVVDDEPLTAFKLAVVGVPLIAALLVAAHAAHGWALDHGARRSGARGSVTRAIRFGLYATGWDLVIGPIGAVVVAFKEGIPKAASIGAIAVGLPTRSAEAFLRGCYRLEGESARPALRASYVAAAIATLVGAVAVIAALVTALLA
jgi:hypothetical protein